MFVDILDFFHESKDALCDIRKEGIRVYVLVGYLGPDLLKVVNPNVDVNADVDETYVNFAYLMFWRIFTSDSTYTV